MNDLAVALGEWIVRNERQFWAASSGTAVCELAQVDYALTVTMGFLRFG
jgi:hypothetical protein